jgi:glycosyltransferase involved in cell wall biosynthesis
MHFSVIIPMYNCQDTILRVVSSVQNQDYPREDFEIICIDDKSTDNTLSIIQKVNSVRLVALPKNGGNGPAKNIGVQMARGNILFFVDDHMYLPPDDLRILGEVFSTHRHISGICGSYTSFRKTDENIVRDIRRRTIYRKDMVAREISIRQFYPFSIAIGAMRKSLFLKNQFSENFHKNGAEDVLLQILHLHDAQTFYYEPRIKGLHDHNLDIQGIMRKLFVEINGTEELIYDLSQKNLKIPYQYGFLSFPLAFVLSVLLIGFHRIFIPVSFMLFVVEVLLASQCLQDNKSPFYFRLKAVLYVLSGEIVKGFYLPLYFLKRRHFKWKVALRSIRQIIIWEISKYGFLPVI